MPNTTVFGFFARKSCTKGNMGFESFGRFACYPITIFQELVGSEEIWECRVQFGSNAYRLFCFFINSVVVLTHGFIKKSQKIPKNEIEKAEFYRQDFLRRRKQ